MLKILNLLGAPALAIVCLAGFADAQEKGGADEPKRPHYFPNTEALAEDEMRVIALGTDTPNFRHSQASASWLVELGNGEKFVK